jgi:ABC-type amino acid transport system permease subunit
MFELYAAAALLYWMVCVAFALSFRLVEKQLSKGILTAR